MTQPATAETRAFRIQAEGSSAGGAWRPSFDRRERKVGSTVAGFDLSPSAVRPLCRADLTCALVHEEYPGRSRPDPVGVRHCASVATGRLRRWSGISSSASAPGGAPCAYFAKCLPYMTCCAPASHHQVLASPSAGALHPNCRKLRHFGRPLSGRFPRQALLRAPAALECHDGSDTRV